MSGDLVRPRVDHNGDVLKAPVSHGGAALLKTRLLSNENIVVEFIEEPVGCC